MIFYPSSFFFLCDSVAKFKKNSLEHIPDYGFEIYVPSACNITLPCFSHNKLYCCSPLGDTLPQWAVAHREINIIFQCSLSAFEIVDILQVFKEKYSEIHNHINLQISDCSVKDFVNIPGIEELFIKFPNITILHETADGTLLNEFISSEHRSRRRPCRYPFESVTMDFEGNVFQCPYCENRLAKYTNFSEILKNPAILRFLATQLLADVSLFCQCANCPYWIDGWLGEEKEYFKNNNGEGFSLLWEGHSCSIKRRKSK